MSFLPENAAPEVRQVNQHGMYKHPGQVSTLDRVDRRWCKWKSELNSMFKKDGRASIVWIRLKNAHRNSQTHYSTTEWDGVKRLWWRTRTPEELGWSKNTDFPAVNPRERHRLRGFCFDGLMDVSCSLCMLGLFTFVRFWPPLWPIPVVVLGGFRELDAPDTP